jgi:uncharacterized protein involved in outer membrane biogenesis
LRGLHVANPKGFQSPSAIRAESVAVAIQPSSVLSDKVIIRSINIVSPQITFEGGLQGNNLSQILANIRGAGPPQDSASARKLQVDDLHISGAQVDITVTLPGAKTATVTLPDIHLAQLGQGPDGITSAELSERLLALLLESAIGAATAELAKGVIPSLPKLPEGVGDLFKRKQP